MKAYRCLSQIISLEKAFQKDGRNLLPEDLSILHNASIVFDQDKIVWVGEEKNFPKEYEKIENINLPGRILLPELVDCHTHLVFGGDRSEEYALRMNGASYEEIGLSGGGILSTVKATNNLGPEAIFSLAQKRIEKIHSYGIGTIEIKSGYGLNLKKERELTHIIHQLKESFAGKVQILNTYMAAHATPRNTTSKKYMREVVLPLLDEVKEIVDAVDIFHEKHYFDSEDCRLLFEKAHQLGIPCKSHADEFYDNQGASLAVQYKCLSTDHLLNTGPEGIKALANSDTVATLLPGTGLFLGVPQANAQDFLKAGCKVALASDFNPGSCHYDNLLMIASLAGPSLKMNSAELWAAITLNAAHALGLKKQGAIIKGLKPRFSLFQVDHLAKVTYSWGKNFADKIGDFS